MTTAASSMTTAASSMTTVASATSTAIDPTTAAAGTPAVGDVTIDETAKGSTVTVHVGAVVTVVLHSTYWHLDAPGPIEVLRANGDAVVAPVLPGQGCVPGQGCGTVTQSSTARAPGRSTLSASRTSCGEALACTPDASAWSVTIVVVA
jgi:hypothetical protein